MPQKKFITWSIMAGLASLVAVLLLTLPRTVRELRLENDQLRQQLKQMARMQDDEQGSLNRRAPADSPDTPAGDSQTELLRLRGQVAWLQRQLEDLQHTAKPSEATQQAQPQEPIQDGVASLKAQLEQGQQRLDSARQYLFDLQNALDVPDEIALLDPDIALNKPSLKKYEQYFKARQDYDQSEQERRLLYLKLLTEAHDAKLRVGGETTP